MRIHTKAVHAGDRKKPPPQIPVVTPIYSAASFVAESTEQLDRIFARTEPGFSYSRYDNPTSAALEELLTELENGYGSLACASGMAALQLAFTAALQGRAKSILAAEAIYGATIRLLTTVFEPSGVQVSFTDIFDLAALGREVAERKPGCVLIETVSNPILRVGDIEAIAGICRGAGAALVVDNTFATPMMVRPLELGAHMSVHSLTKYLAGHGDVLGGSITSDREHYDAIRALSRAYGPVLGPFECYLAMRGIKTFPLRFERQCANARTVAGWLHRHARVERVFFPGDPEHPDAALVKRLFPKGLYGGMVSFEIRGARRQEVYRFIDSLKLVVRATSLGDVHSLLLYPVVASHRDVPPEIREERMGIRENLVRLSLGIEAAEDIILDLDQALQAAFGKL